MKTSSVPKLNLAPRRRRLLLLWDPLDYLQLLNWFLFFPQAVRWYVEACKKQEIDSGNKTWREVGRVTSRADIGLQGLVLGLFLYIIAVYSIGFFSTVEIATSVFFGVFAGTWLGVALGGLENSVFLFAITVFIIAGFASSINLSFTITLGAVAGMIRGAVPNAVKSISSGLATSVALCTVVSILDSFEGGVEVGVAFYVAFCIAFLRPEMWMLACLVRQLPHYRSKTFSHTTALPVSGLTLQIYTWLDRDWTRAVRNINELLAYTKQFAPAVIAINRSLACAPNDLLLLEVSELAGDPFDWNLIRYASASLTSRYKEQVVEGTFYLPKFIRQRIKKRFDVRMRLDTPARAVAAGFWYLHEDQAHQAAEAFARVKHLPFGQEMQQLSTCLALALNARTLNDPDLITNLTIPTSFLLRADTWTAISRLRSIVDDAQIISQSYSRSARSLALNRALGKITEILEKAHLVPQAERNLVITIAQSWQEKLLAIAADIGEIKHTTPVHNPYIAGDPVEGDLFVGRGEVIKQLEELWLMSHQLQSVVLYGHRRMGKTSILKNLPNYLGNNVQVVYINLLNLGAVSEGTGEVLMTLSDAISQQFSLKPPDDDALLRLPEVTFRRFVQTINQKLKKDQGLIIALDEFEKIEELILADKLSPDFLGFLRGLLQEYPQIAFAFAGLHTLEEMAEDYFNPLFASVLPIRVGFFTLGETRQLLANPAEDFTLDYTPETLNEIYRLTAGQPYLTQLVGFQLVRHYNHQVFEENRERSPIFTPEDLTTVIQHSDFFAKGRYYFTGVWNQAAQDTPGQQTTLRILAQKIDGFSVSDICRRSKLSEAEVTEALKTLKRHDVVISSDDKWKIIVPLFRQWVLNHQ